MTHEALKDGVPALALNALEPAEEMELRTHLQTCPECAELLLHHRDTAGMLALAADPVQPSPGLRERVLSEARRTGGVKDQTVRSLKPVLRWEKPVAALAVAAVITSAAFSGWLALRIRSQDKLIGEQRRAFAVASSPNVDVTPMSGSSGASQGQVFLSADAGGAAVLLTRLPDPGSKVYTLWLVAGGKPTNLRSFRPDEAGVAVVYVSRPVKPGAKVAVTVEPRRDNVAPTGPIVLSS